MARQILSNNTQDLSTMRQRAFQDNVNQISGALNQYGAYQDKKALTERQLALQDQAQNMKDIKDAVEMTKMSGQQITPEQVKMMRTGAVEPAQMGANGMGPPAPNAIQSMLGGISGKQAMAEEQEAKDRELNERLKEAQIKKLLTTPSDSMSWEHKKQYEAEQRKKEKTAQAVRDREKRLVPGLGYALNDSDAKQLKDAKQMKNKFDRQIGEMISLREKYGTEFGNREAVGRGKQLSKDLLLTYKNLAKLGVLSKSDEDIVNAIIPSDPLQFDASNLIGQDPTLHVLKKFKGDLDSDYAETLRNRLEGGQQVAANMGLENGGTQAQGSNLDFLAVPSANASPAIEHPQANEAINWAKSNPNDPRAQAILQRVGVR